MKSFYEGFQQDDAELIESLSRVVYELRENRKSLLEQYEATDEREILDDLQGLRGFFKPFSFYKKQFPTLPKKWR